MKGSLAFALLTASFALPLSAQSDVAAAVSGDRPRIMNLMHIIHAVNTLGPTTSFYHQLFGIEIPATRPFAGDGPARLNNVDGLTLDVVMATIQPANLRMEFTEFHHVERSGRQALATDPGSVQLVLHVRDLDTVVDAARKLGAPIVTTGGAPVNIETANGPRRSIVIRDPDGYMVRAIEDTPEEATTAGQLQAGVALDVGVASLTDTMNWYREELGLDATGDATFKRDPAMRKLVGAPAGSEYREASVQLPMSNARLVFSEWRGMPRTRFHERVPDPGAGGFVSRVSDLDGMVKVFRAHHVHIESKGSAPVWLTRTSYNVFIEDPNGLNLELSQIIPLDQQKPGESSGHP
ncbi:MAG TPA: VOC family protein [Steroidobacteraceae bacterium]|nr:VOC family protein [Steroidobacteraceae bacterium]